MRFKDLLLFALLCLAFVGESQTLFPEAGKVFDDEVVPKVYVEVDPDDFAEMINTLENEDHYPVTFIFDNGNDRDTLENVGLRLRGNTSLFSEKKSFKIAFNAFETGRKYKGLEKMNINGEHNDPSVIRSKLGWDLCKQMGIPSSRSNHVELYINNEYYGLYINVEHIDEEFAQLRYGNEIGNLYKCTWPATLEYLGNNPDNYKIENGGRRTYELKTNLGEDDYSDIAHFIDVLNNTPNNEFPCELEKVFDVQNYLKVIAFDILTANWDGPIYNKNNFYLYQNPQTGKMQYIPYDIDNSFGIKWFGEWTNRNIYSWSPNGEPRPIYTKIMANDQYRAQFTYYMEQFLELYFTEDDFFDRIDEVKNLIEGSIPDDPFYPLDYGFTVDDFNDSYTQSLDVSHVPHGIKEYIELRINSATNQLESTNAAPIISNVFPEAGNLNQDIFVRAKIENEGAINAFVSYTLGSQNGQAILYDDGLHNDGAPGDQVYGATIPAIGESGILEYFISAEDMQSNSNRFPYCETLEVFVSNNTTGLYINEFQSNNETTIADEAGEFDDWIELYNAGNQTINLGNFFLSDSEDDLMKWALPDEVLEAGGFALIWADEDEDQGPFHSNFKLNADGESIFLTNSDGEIMDQYTYSRQENDESTGRLPNGTGIMQGLIPTPGASNQPLVSTEVVLVPSYKMRPNPFDQTIFIEAEESIKGVDIYNLLGQSVFQKRTLGNQVRLDLPILDHGIYLLKIQFANGLVVTEKVIKG